jgi:hypothetical protein
MEDIEVYIFERSSERWQQGVSKAGVLVLFPRGSVEKGPWGLV